MDAIQALNQRVSVSKLKAPAPNQQQRDVIFQAALRAADHGQMRPWRFLVVEGEGLDALGELFCKAAITDNPDLKPEVCDSYRKMPHRAPLIIVVIATYHANPKVPEIEQTLSAGAAAQNILNASYAEGVGAIWKTGVLAYHPVVQEGLGMADGESIVGFIYMGTPITPIGSANPGIVADFFTEWPSR